MKLHRLTFIKKLNKLKSKGNQLILCKCDCGNSVEIGVRNFIRGERQKCGSCSDIVEVTKTEHYRRAEKIIRRCSDPKNEYYHRYGGRGIENHLGKTPGEVVLSLLKVPGYQDGYQIDRIDNDGHYTIIHPIHGDKIWEDEFGNKCLGNLRWVSPAFNSMNKSTNVTITSLATVFRRKRDLDRIIEIRPNLKLEDFIIFSRKREDNRMEFVAVYKSIELWMRDVVVYNRTHYTQVPIYKYRQLHSTTIPSGSKISS